MYERLSRYYDLSHAALTEDIPFMLDMAAETGGPVLEWGCGSGRLLLPLARAGYVVTGIDNSPAMLALAEQRLANESSAVRDRVRLLETDMTAAYLPGEPQTMALIVAGVNTFMHLDEPQALFALRNAARLLTPDGLLVIDVDNPFSVAAAGEDEGELEVEGEWLDPAIGRMIRQWAAYVARNDEQVVDVTWAFEELGPDAPDPTVVEMRYHYIYPHQYDLLLQQSGLRLAALFGDYHRAEFIEESDRLIVLVTPV